MIGGKYFSENKLVSTIQLPMYLYVPKETSRLNERIGLTISKNF